MHLGEAQRDMRQAYVNGGVGILVSGLVWAVAGLVAYKAGLPAGMAALVFGGILIPPLSLLLARKFFRRGRTRSPNPMEMLALQATVFLIIGLVIAYLVQETYGDWFFAIALLAVGGRYLVFQTVYGMRVFMVLGALLIAVAGIAILWPAFPPFAVALVAGTIEIICATLMLAPAKR